MGTPTVTTPAISGEVGPIPAASAAPATPFDALMALLVPAPDQTAPAGTDPSLPVADPTIPPIASVQTAVSAPQPGLPTGGSPARAAVSATMVNPAPTTPEADLVEMLAASALASRSVMARPPAPPQPWVGDRAQSPDPARSQDLAAALSKEQAADVLASDPASGVPPEDFIGPVRPNELTAEPAARVTQITALPEAAVAPEDFVGPILPAERQPNADSTITMSAAEQPMLASSVPQIDGMAETDLPVALLPPSWPAGSGAPGPASQLPVTEGLLQPSRDSSHETQLSSKDMTALPAVLDAVRDVHLPVQSADHDPMAPDTDAAASILLAAIGSSDRVIKDSPPQRNAQSAGPAHMSTTERTGDDLQASNALVIAPVRIAGIDRPDARPMPVKQTPERHIQQEAVDSIALDVPKESNPDDGPEAAPLVDAAVLLTQATIEPAHAREDLSNNDRTADDADVPQRLSAMPAQMPVARREAFSAHAPLSAAGRSESTQPPSQMATQMVDPGHAGPSPDQAPLAVLANAPQLGKQMDQRRAADIKGVSRIDAAALTVETESTVFVNLNSARETAPPRDGLATTIATSVQGRLRDAANQAEPLRAQPAERPVEMDPKLSAMIHSVSITGTPDHAATSENLQTLPVSPTLTPPPADPAAHDAPMVAAVSSEGRRDTQRDAEIRERQIKQQVTMALRSGGQEVRMQLYPPGLGQVMIRLALDGQKLRLSVKADNAEASDALMQAESGLRDALSRDGFNLTDFDVHDDERRQKREKSDTPTHSIPDSGKADGFSVDMTA